ncbi:MAG: hypothetical protein KC549_09300 [Myxococcales bacterium]|nr:hypothetical protein [Myxococcales bacterium]
MKVMLVALILVAGCVQPMVITSERAPLSQAEQDTVDLILGLNPWPTTLPGATYGNQSFTLSDVHEYLDAAEALAALTTGQIKNVYEAVWFELKSDGVDTELGDYVFFVLWRIVAEVPPAVPLSSMKFHSPHAAPYDRTWLQGTVRMYPADYPLVLNTNGKLTEIESLLGAQSTYLCWYDFEELVADYGRRTPTEVAAMRP